MASEVEALEKRLVDKITGMQRDFRAWIRPMTQEAYQCAATAYGNKSLDADAADAAAEKCFEKIDGLKEQLSTEMANFQSRMQQCHHTAAESVRGDVAKGSTATEDQIARKYVGTLRPCVETHLAELPVALERVQRTYGGAKSSWFSR